MTRATILDTGPLVAFVNEQDDHHAWAVEQFKTPKVLLTCEAVITEACFLLRGLKDGADTIGVSGLFVSYVAVDDFSDFQKLAARLS